MGSTSIGRLLLDPRPDRPADACDRRFGAARRKVDEQPADTAVRHRLQMVAQRLDCPAFLIVRGVDYVPGLPNELNEACFARGFALDDLQPAAHPPDQVQAARR